VARGHLLSLQQHATNPHFFFEFSLKRCAWDDQRRIACIMLILSVHFCGKSLHVMLGHAPLLPCVGGTGNARPRGSVRLPSKDSTPKWSWGAFVWRRSRRRQPDPCATCGAEGEDGPRGPPLAPQRRGLIPGLEVLGTGPGCSAVLIGREGRLGRWAMAPFVMFNGWWAGSPRHGQHI
jgi:hypothetical protein